MTASEFRADVATRKPAIFIGIRDSSPCIVYGVGSHREGTQRLCIEHKQRVSRLDMICFTHIAPHTVCGMPGLCITAADANMNKLTLLGPPGLQDFLQSTKHFVTIKLALTTTELRYNVMSFRGEDYTIHAVPLTSRCCYITERDGLLGKFDVARAQELGIPKGPLFAKLKSGQDITLDDGRVICPHEVVAPTSPPQFAAIICNVSDADELFAQPIWERFYATGDAYEHMESMIHLSDVSVVTSVSYLTWLRQFHPQVKHIFVGAGCGGVSAYVAATRYSSKLHSLFPTLFSHIALSDTAASLSLPNDISSTFASPGLTNHLQPMRVRGTIDLISNTDRAALVQADLDEFRSSLTCEAKDATFKALQLQDQVARTDNSTAVRELLLQHNMLEHGADHHVSTLLQHRRNALMFLGTGCAVPSKYRNVSGIFLQLNGGGMLLDAGEGTWQQLLRMAKHTPEVSTGENIELWAAQQIKAVWISHPHADHHLGLVRVIVERYRVLLKQHEIFQPLVVFAPTSVLLFLKSCGLVDKEIESKAYVGISNKSLDPYADLATMDTCADVLNSCSEMRTEEIGANQYENVCNYLFNTLGVRLTNVRVHHCKQSYAIRLDSTEGWSVVYSGDTRPCSAVEQLAADATILVHEATFDDTKPEEAVMKKHSTIGEAIGVSSSANAFRTILTHFSQRYTAVPAIDIKGVSHVALAFDFMRITFQDLLWAPATTSALCAAFPEECDDLDDDEVSECSKKRCENSVSAENRDMIEKRMKLAK